MTPDAALASACCVALLHIKVLFSTCCLCKLDLLCQGCGTRVAVSPCLSIHGSMPGPA